jgi:endothelin-converting enzyme
MSQSPKAWLLYVLITNTVTVEKMQGKIGYQTKNPNEANPQDLYEYYADMKMVDNFFDNFVYGVEWSLNKSWVKLLKPTDRDEWVMTSPTVNAYYDAALNQFFFPAGIMQNPNFSGDLPEYISYGAFGATVGHEMTHGFDDNGSKYDAAGRYRTWWDNSTISRFENQTQCFVKQYGQYSVEGLDGEKVNVNGKLTLGENIADGGGINNAFRAWKKRETASGTPNAGLPGLEKFTNDQLFYISYGNSWCEKMRKEALLKQVLSNEHSPADTRILGPLENAVDFKKAFNCPVKEAKCSLW